MQKFNIFSELKSTIEIFLTDNDGRPENIVHITLVLFGLLKCTHFISIYLFHLIIYYVYSVI